MAQSDHLIMVTGLGRCGSSLTLQMLHSGGVPCVGDWPSFEDENTFPGLLTPDWLGRQRGALKVLDPQLHDRRIFEGENLSIIFLRRESTEQARSSAKFLNAFGGQPQLDRLAVKRMAASIRADTAKAERLFQNLRRPVLFLTFERLVAAPGGVAEQIAHFIRPHFTADPAAMAAAYFHRGPKPARCLPYMLEVDLLAAASP